ncbi:hypothetical protein BH10BAC2_BH10BAC2_19320 [soil metagenome]
MRHINDNIEELFQKAAEEYPLRTGTPDWKGVQYKLFLQKTADKGKFNGNFRLPIQKWTTLVLLTMIPLSTAITRLMFNTPTVVKNGLANVNIPISASYVSISEVKLNSRMSAKEEQTTPHELIADYGYLNNNNDDSNGITFDTNTITSLQEHFVNNYKLSFNQDEQLSSKIRPVTDDNPLTFNNILTGNIIPSILVTDKKTINLLVQNTNNTHSIKIKSTPNTNFYAGIFAASELTNVRGQSFRKPGFNGGFLVGYDLNKRVQAEVGIVFSRKYYYSDGKYAAKNSLRQDELEVGGVNIYSQITEIPVTLRYNFKNTIDNKLFAAAGGVVNIVNQERYNYGYTKNGHTKKGFKKYNESINNVFSNIQVSLGYEYKLGNIGYMRIEPYYRIPLNGIGTSNLPVTSVGINFGLIKHFK